jgi:uncharacterized protein (DUF433 family)
MSAIVYSHELTRKAGGCSRFVDGVDRNDLHHERTAMPFTRITVNPAQMGGVPCIRGLRIPVATVVDMVADGMSEGEILHAYPDLEAADIKEALQFAAESVRERELPLLFDR